MKASGQLDKVVARQGGAGGMLEPGGYAALVHAVVDGTEEPNPYVGLVLNLLDPKTNQLMHTADLADPEQWWRHTYRYFVGEYGGAGIDWARYKALVDAVEGTTQNKGFKYVDADGGEQQLAGKWLGVVMRRYLYVPKRGKHAGEQREGVELAWVCTADEAREGSFPPQAAERRDGRPDGLRGTPWPPVPQVVAVPPVQQPAQQAPTVQAQPAAVPPAQQAPAPVAGPLGLEDIPF